MAKKRKKTAYEYSGLTVRKRKQDVINKLKYEKGISPSRIVSVNFNKRKQKGFWKFKAVVVSKKK